MPLYPGKPVLYRYRPGEVRMGQTEAAAMIKRLYDDGSAELVIYPAGSRDPLFQDKVPQMSETRDFHCWRLNPDDERMEKFEQRIAELEAQLAAHSEPIGDPMQIAAEISGVHAAMIGIHSEDARPRRGRPRKVPESA